LQMPEAERVSRDAGILREYFERIADL